jgi:hypothetical protein
MDWIDLAQDKDRWLALVAFVNSLELRNLRVEAIFVLDKNWP